MALKISAEAIVMMLVVSVHICHGKISVTYSFPTDSCVSAPYLVDENTMVIMKFEGDFGSPDCRQMSFTTPKSAFYSYTMCMKELYYSSPKCQSKVYFQWYWSYYDNYYYDSMKSYDYKSEKISGEGCSDNSYDSNSMFARCLNDGSQVSFEMRKSEKGIPDNVNDTFKFQIETNWDYNYVMIGGISGGIVGLCIFTGVGIYLCINCRRRKRVTGRYCCACLPSCSKFMKEGIAQGFSAELTAANILLCSCVICRRQNRKQHEQDQCEKVTVETDCTSTDSENKWETVTGFKDQDSAPLCDS